MKGKGLIILSIISTLIVVCWMITDFFGGMMIYLIMFAWIIVPFILIYFVSALFSIRKIIKNGIKSNKILFYSHAFGISMILLFSLSQLECLKSRILLDATLVDDLSSINLVLRENGHFETTTSGMYGFSNKISGKYLRKNDTIIFLKKPYTNDFIPDKIIIDKQDRAIYFNKDSKGQFIREKTFVNYFSIDKNEL